ncbi:hypothetical protein ACTHSM_04920 [Neisseria sp. P0009.S001]|uniref:hypothetical protein n=3 Tax=Neisseria TaxID=482 RepID=UPI003F7FB5CE
MDSNLRQVNEFIKVIELVDDSNKESEIIQSIEDLNIPLYFKVGNRASREKMDIYIKRMAPIDIYLRHIKNKKSPKDSSYTLPKISISSLNLFKKETPFEYRFLNQLSLIKPVLFQDYGVGFTFSNLNLNNLDYPKLDAPMMIAVCGQPVNMHEYQFNDELKQDYEEVEKYLKKEAEKKEAETGQTEFYSSVTSYFFEKNLEDILIDSFENEVSEADKKDFIKRTGLSPQIITKFFNSKKEQPHSLPMVLDKIKVEAEIKNFYTNNYYIFNNYNNKFEHVNYFWKRGPQGEIFNFFKSNILQVNINKSFRLKFQDLYILKSDIDLVKEEVYKRRLMFNLGYSQSQIEVLPENLRTILDIIKILEKKPIVEKKVVDNYMQSKFPSLLSDNHDKRLAFLTSLVKKKRNLHFNKKSNNVGMSKFLKLLCDTFIWANQQNPIVIIKSHADLIKAMERYNFKACKDEFYMIEKLQSHSWFLFGRNLNNA